ncbi:hypothetical protein [uncultured Methanobrevibacter sp.]|uniref:hypothetical protein n=1 Tax=uncultured Methanobrevibacter sp. TaxID=253161 RepID=UPI0025D4E36C|nr:hypothetical protein [uncultured Methanobrevibacter sp.]
MVEYENELQVLVYDEFGDVIVKKDEEIEAKNRELGQKNKEIDELIKSNKEYKDKIKQLNDMDDLSEEAKKIISSLM